MIAMLKGQNTRLGALPDIPTDFKCLACLELEGESADVLEERLADYLALLVKHGGNEEDTWAAAGTHEMEKFRLLRHAAPEAVNLLVDRRRMTASRVYKICLDLCAPVERLSEAVALYESDIVESGLCGAVFGQASVNRMHVNLIPGNEEEITRAKVLLKEWAAAAIR